MKIHKAAMSCLLGGVLAVAAMAADVTGTWTAEMQGRNGQTMKQTFNLKADGDKLSGTVSGRGGETEISDGKIKGDKVSFTVKREFNGNSFVMHFDGKVDGDQLKLQQSIEGREGMNREITAKREK